MTRKLVTFLPAFALLLGLSVAPLFADEIADAIAAVPPGVEEIYFAGTWTTDSAGGTYRVIVVRATVKPITARIFVQWIALDADGASVAQSTEVKEFAELKVDVASIGAEGDVDGLAVHVESATGDTFELFASAPGEYRFGRASN